jgi:hypothetical protein
MGGAMKTSEGVETSLSAPVKVRFTGLYGGPIANTENEDQKRTAEFQLAEYRESANAYFKGVDIGYTGIRGYITINALFATALGLLAKTEVQPDATLPVVQHLAALNDIIRILPVFPLLASLAFFSTFPHYFKHLQNCQRRCAEIESERGGEMFKRLGNIAYNRNKIGAVVGAVLIVIPIVIFWAILSARLRSFEYPLEIMKSIKII